jgi:flagellar hook-associated protein 3 FlgL
MRLDAMTRQVSLAGQMQADASREASSGLRVGAPSDDPVAAAQAARVQAQFDGTTAYRTTIRNGRGDVELAESSLSSAGDVLQSAHDLAMQGVNGSLSAANRAVMADQVAQLKEELVGLGNTKGAQGYLFGGTASEASPFDANGTFLGNSNDRVAQVGPNLSTVVSVSGALAFTGAGGSDVFAALQSLQTALSTNNVAGISASVSSLDAAQRQVLAARVDAGMKLSRLDVSDAAHGTAQTALNTEKNALVQADPAMAYSKLMAVQSSLEQAITVARSMLSTMSANRFG